MMQRMLLPDYPSYTIGFVRKGMVGELNLFTGQSE
jgi:hypothetical protein